MKKVNFTKTPVEYELAPYEMLMSDIQKGPRLNKIMVDGELPPRLKKDAHDIILQFIKARPPLKPVRKKNMKIVVNIVLLIQLSTKNLEEIQDQIVICAKKEIKVQKRNKSLKKK